MVKDAIPGGDTGHYDANRMFWEPMRGAGSVATGGTTKRYPINAGFPSIGASVLGELPGNIAYGVGRAIFGAYDWLFFSQLPSQPVFTSHLGMASSGRGYHKR
jgi:hypothetical protein